MADEHGKVIGACTLRLNGGQVWREEQDQVNDKGWGMPKDI